MMKTCYSILFLVAYATLQPAIFGQGSLTPPAGPPAPTMKSLAQIEPRRAISQNGTSAYVIAFPGTYYLTADITGSNAEPAIAIDIAANNVTLDLNGFTLTPASNGGSSTAIRIVNVHNIEIKNGHIKGTTTFNGTTYSGSNTFTHGIAYFGATPPQNVTISNMHIDGVSGDGINIGKAGNVVRDCVVNVAGGSGILADVVSDCVVNQAGAAGIDAYTVQNSRGSATGANASGIYAATVSNSFGYSTGTSGYGINATSAAMNCYGQSISGTGLFSSGPATGCVGYSNTGTGLESATAMNCYGESVSGSVGLKAVSSASNCHGKASGGSPGYGIYVNKGTASNCYGLLNNNSIGGYGIYVGEGTAIGCYGESNATSGNGYGIQASNAIGCFGRGNWIGIEVGTGTAQNCRGIGNNLGIAGNILVSCTGTNLGGSHKYLSGIGPDS